MATDRYYYLAPWVDVSEDEYGPHAVAWDSALAYARGTIAKHDGKFYRADADVEAGTEPPTAPWQRVRAWTRPPHTVGVVDLRPLTPVDTFGFFATDTELVGSEYERFGAAGERIADATLSQSDRQRWADILGLDARPDGPTLLDVLWQTLTQYADPDGGTLAPPLTATHKGVMELHLGGHSLIRAQRFRGVKDPAWPRVQALLQRNYRRIAQQAQRGARGEPTLHRKWLECQRRKYRVDPRLLVPGDMPYEPPIKPTTTVSDDFSRADSTNLGANWTEVVGDVQILSGQVDNTAASRASARYESDLSSEDHYVQLDETDGANFRGMGACARYDASAETYYSGVFIATGAAEVYKTVSGSDTNLDSASTTEAAFPQTVRTTADGSTISFKVAGTEYVSLTDTAITGNLRTGFGGFRSDWDSARCDNFEAADLVAAAAAFPFQNYYALAAQGGTL